MIGLLVSARSILDESMRSEKTNSDLEDIKGISSRLYEQVKHYSELMKPEQVRLIKGLKAEYNELVKEMVEKKELIPLNKSLYPGCYLYRSDKNDVARSEESTYICTQNKDETGPTNNWVEESTMLEKLNALLNGIMAGKTMYVVPYLLGPKGSDFARCGVELTDSRYVVISEMIIAKVGKEAIDCIKNGDFVLGVQATNGLDTNNKYVTHFPRLKLIITVNSAYGGNALLSKKCHALRIASYLDKSEDRLAEHMMAIEVTNPDKMHFGIAAAFPSGSGKTNFAMLKPPEGYANWNVELLSDDIIWMLIKNGELRATNPEYGFFGIAPGTNENTNPNALHTINRNTIFTNVALNKEDMSPWWEGLTEAKPESLEDWQGNSNFTGFAAHPNARFTTPISQYPYLSKAFGSKEGLRIDAILFGGKRSSLIPLVYEAYSIEHGILIGAMLRAETTAAVGGQIGVIRNDPMAMRPFCGYNMADYFDHMRNVLKKLDKKPKIYGVNWFRKDAKGALLWPGFGKNMEVVEWITERIMGNAAGIETPIGIIPEKSEFEKGDISEEALDELFRIDKAGWLNELQKIKPFFESFGEHMPKWLWEEYYKLKEWLEEGR
ncbi:MAG: phosphoenolpyruvate carboxykinase (GTP) [Candidatus Micrarchaeia archaeon]